MQAQALPSTSEGIFLASQNPQPPNLEKQAPNSHSKDPWGRGHGAAPGAVTSLTDGFSVTFSISCLATGLDAE